MILAYVTAEPSPKLGALAEKVAGTCFVLGLILVLAGVAIGLWISLQAEDMKESPSDDTKQKLKVTATKATETNAAAESLNQLIEDGLPEGAESLKTIAEAATATGQKAKETAEAASAAQDLQSLISALPVKLRFHGLVILIGTTLMSVGTIQFGGTSLF